jgi:hypothetical protein
MKEKKAPKAAKKTDSTPARFKVGDRVRVKDLPNMFYSRTQIYARGVSGTIAARTYHDLIPEDEAFNRDGRLEQYYIVRFRQKDLWEEYRSERCNCQRIDQLG